MKRKLTYAIGDIHGHLNSLVQLLDHIETHRQYCDAESTIICVGDYVDRGPNSKGVIELLMKKQSEKFICLMGNHENMFLNAMVDDRDMSYYIYPDNGGHETLKSYGFAVDTDHLLWLSGLPFMHEDEHRVYVHAGIDPWVELKDQQPEVCMWIRDKFLRADGASFQKHVVHGHTPYHHGKQDVIKPELLPHRTNLDTGVCFGGLLTAAVFDDSIPNGPITYFQVAGDL
jgi:serine/threonine protein phosphatase 1